MADVAIEIEPHVHAVQRSRILCAAALGYDLQGPALAGLHAGGLAAAAPLQNAASGNSFAPKKPVVALVHGTSRADKEWPQAAWVALGQRLNHAGFAVALAHGNASEKATSEAIAKQLHDAWVWPAMALDAMTDTLAQCAGVVGVDSGVSHIAVALDLPHVQIYNFDTAWRTGTRGAGRYRRRHRTPPAAAPVQRVWPTPAHGGRRVGGLGKPGHSGAVPMMRALYSLAVWLAQPLVRRKLRRRAVVEPLYGQHLDERFGHYAQAAPAAAEGPLVWLHAVSLGETLAAATLVTALRAQWPGMRLLLTHGTATGRAAGGALVAARRCAGLAALGHGGARCAAFLPTFVHSWVC